MRKQNGATSIVITKAVAETAGREGSYYPDVLTDGEAAVVSPSGKILTNVNVVNYDKVQVVVKQGTGYMKSGFLTAKTITSYKGSLAALAVQQVKTLGYNGTAGALDVIAGNHYGVSMIVKSTKSFGFKLEENKSADYKTGDSDTQYDIASGLQSGFIEGFSKSVDQKVLTEKICDEAGAAVPVGVGTLTFTKNSNVIAAGTDIDATLVIGDFLRVGTTTSDPVYRIVDMDTTANTAIIDVPYQGASQTVADPNATMTYIASATGLAGDWGVKFTAIEPYYSYPEFPYSRQLLYLRVNNFGDTPITTVNGGYDGRGLSTQVDEMERLYTSVQYLNPQPQPKVTYNTVDGKFYSILNIKFYNNVTDEAGIANNRHPNEAFMAFESTQTSGFATGNTGTATTVADTGVIPVLDAWVVAFKVGSAQAANL